MLSIIFLHWVEEGGPLKETFVSLESIFKYTTVPFELIMVSNGSCQECLDGCNDIIENNNSDNQPVNVLFHNFPENAGVSKGFNEGLKLISNDSKYISIYSNDWVCSPNWDKLLIEELDKDINCGFVTACTNWGAGSMCDSSFNPVKFQKHKLSPEDPELFIKVEKIAEHTLRARGKTNYNNFVCMGWLFKREVFDKVGLMDERIHTCNDVSYSRLGFLHGYTSKTVWAAYIQHFFHASFSQINNPITYDYIKPLEAQDYLLMATDKLYKNK